jgi:Flp pilus assembly protein TadD
VEENKELSPAQIAKFEALFQRGTDFLMDGKAKQALPLLESAYEMDGEHFQVRLNLAGAYILNGKFKKAVPVLEQLRNEGEPNAHVWQNLGAAYLGNPILATTKQQDKAIAAFEKALEINPIAPNVAYNIALIYRDRKDKGKASYWFTRAIQADPIDSDARRNLAKLQENDPVG